MYEKEYGEIFCKIGLKDETKERIISNCISGKRASHKSGWAKISVAMACGLLLFFVANTFTVMAYGVDIVSKVYTFIQEGDKNIVEVNDPERLSTSPNLKSDISEENTNIELYKFLKEYDLNDLFVPQNLAKDWTLFDKEFSYYGGCSYDMPNGTLKSIYFILNNGKDQIYAAIKEGASDAPFTFQIGIDYAETRAVDGIEFLIVHKTENLTYEKYLEDVEAFFRSIEGGSTEYKNSTAYKEMMQEVCYQRYIGYRRIISFCAGGYTYTYSLTDGIDAYEFIDDLN